MMSAPRDTSTLRTAGASAAPITPTGSSCTCPLRRESSQKLVKEEIWSSRPNIDSKCQKTPINFIIMYQYPIYRPEKYSVLSQSRLHFSPHHDSKYNTRATFGRSRSPPSIKSSQSRVKGETIKGNSKIEYVPYQKKVIDYLDQRHYSVVPRKRLISEYKDEKRIEIVPREVSVTDYYAVEHIRRYIPQTVPEKTIEYVPVERKNIKYEYIPVERQIVHLPQQPHEEEIPRYLGVRQREGYNRYDNVSEQDIMFWEREYGYRRGESIEVLNQKIREKYERQKQEYFNSSPQARRNSVNYSRI